MTLDMFDLIPLIKTAGYLGIFGMIFAESGLFFGFFFPGDSLLFTAGFLASQGFLDIYTLLVLCFAGAMLGENVGYWFGRKTGPRIFTKDDSLFFKKEYISKAETFFAKHGPISIVLACFIPIVRTFTPILAGVGRMPYRRFLTFNLIGALLWSVGVTLLGYFLGQAIPGIDRYLLPIIAGIIIISVLPNLYHFLKARKKG